MKLPFSLRSASLIAAVIVVSLVLGGAASYLFLQKSPTEIKFAPLVKQADLPFHPIETFAQSLQTTLPADSSSYSLPLASAPSCHPGPSLTLF